MMNISRTPTDFAVRLLAWFEQYGRHDLPWQQHKKQTADIYAVWLSEIMLQQTQVATVLNYFPRFMQTFPSVQDLANADWEAVAELWAGLGYYARAKNLHAGAKQVVQFIDVYGHFPQTVDEWQTIKGVGRSTAGAIVAMGVGARGVICDGNVKRVLTRHRAIEGDITKSATDKLLWQLADELTPTKNSGHFAQAMMDLGATVCTRTQPKCTQCPVADDCMARQQHKQTAYPVKTKRFAKPARHSLAVRLVYQGQTLWLKRHQEQGGGIWQGLWCLPLLTIAQTAPTDTTTNALIEQLSLGLTDKTCLDSGQETERLLFGLLSTVSISAVVGQTIKHTLTHFHWYLSLLTININEGLFVCINKTLADVQDKFVWQNSQTAIPVAISKLLSY